MPYERRAEAKNTPNFMPRHRGGGAVLPQIAFQMVGPTVRKQILCVSTIDHKAPMLAGRSTTEHQYAHCCTFKTKC